MLTRFEARGFKLLRDVAVDLSPLTVLVGANGTGKTTLLDGIDWLLSIARQGAASNEWPPADALAGRSLAELLSRPDADRLGLTLARTDAPPLTLELSRQESSARKAADALSRRVEHPELTGLPSHVRLQLDTQRLAKPSAAATGRLPLAPDGSGLATVLHDVAGRRDGTIDAIESDLARLVPDFRRVHTESIELTWTETEMLQVEGHFLPRQIKRSGGGYRVELAFNTIGRIPAAHVSEGTLLALGLITALRVDAPNVILIDDTERALHPLAQQGLVHLLRDAIERSNGSLQVIATTHSPYLIDACEPGEVCAFGRKADGTAAVLALTEHPEAKKWLELLEPGEFWTSVGEEWVGEVLSKVAS